jgi:hypothetical protein
MEGWHFSDIHMSQRKLYKLGGYIQRGGMNIVGYMYVLWVAFDFNVC